MSKRFDRVIHLFHGLSKTKLWQRTIIAMVLGTIAGLFLKEQAQMFEPLGLIFLNLIKMIIMPMIFFTLVYGITNIQDSKDIKRIGLKAIVVFLTTAAFAVFIGIATAHFVKPGVGKQLLLMEDTAIAAPAAASSLTKILLEIIPTNAVKAFAEGNILQVILFSFFVGFALNTMRDRCKIIIGFCHEGAFFSFKMIQSIMKLAPLGVFGYIAATVGMQGLEVVIALGKLICTIFVACGIQYVMFGVLILVWGKMSPLSFYKKMIEPQVLAFSTSSSKATLTTLMNVAETKLGISKPNSRFLIPLASALNMDGGAIYQGACAIFFAQMFGVDLSFVQYLTLLFMCTIASIGGAGIPGGVLLFLGMVLTSVGLPIEGVLLVASIDRILDMLTTMINVTGDACVALLIDRSEGTLNKEVYKTMDNEKAQVDAKTLV
jgi:Na+/H+-dicarboxylate symporter